MRNLGWTNFLEAIQTIAYGKYINLSKKRRKLVKKIFGFVIVNGIAIDCEVAK